MCLKKRCSCSPSDYMRECYAGGKLSEEAGLALMFVLNLRHAINNYGITTNNKLHIEILAQSNSSGGSSGSGSGSGSDSSGYGGGSSMGSGGVDYSHGYSNEQKDRKVTETRTCEVDVQIPDWVPYVGGTVCSVKFDYTVEFDGTSNACRYTGNNNEGCSYYTCKKNGS
ncbi:MAG: hypothetical protein LBG28_07905 [Tannerella sp.]|jgi:hypothetical protein|nr:hypothetical protein [Tannerella sp.]